jgi:lipopolysaccharide transport system permease protein
VTTTHRSPRQWRELVVLLTLREFRRRFVSMVAGLVFTLGVSLATLLVLSTVFGTVFRDRVTVPYPLFIFCGLIPWTFVQSTLNHSVDSFRANANLVRKVNFPRPLVPLSVASVNFVVLAVSMVALVPFLLAGGFLPDWHWLWMIVALLSAVMVGAGLAMLLSTLGVYYVEIRPLTDVGLMLWFYATPVFYPASIVPPHLSWISRANPMTHVVEIARSALVYRANPPLDSIAIALGCGVVCLAAGFLVLRRHAGDIADRVS